MVAVYTCIEGIPSLFSSTPANNGCDSGGCMVFSSILHLALHLSPMNLWEGLRSERSGILSTHLNRLPPLCWAILAENSRKLALTRNLARSSLTHMSFAQSKDHTAYYTVYLDRNQGETDHSKNIVGFQKEYISWIAFKIDLQYHIIYNKQEPTEQISSVIHRRNIRSCIIEPIGIDLRKYYTTHQDEQDPIEISQKK